MRNFFTAVVIGGCLLLASSFTYADTRQNAQQYQPSAQYQGAPSPRTAHSANHWLPASCRSHVTPGAKAGNYFKQHRNSPHWPGR